MKSLIKSSAILGGAEIAIVIINIVRAKYLAITIGPEGLGVFSVLSSFFLLLSAFCGGWLSQAYIKYVAEFEKENKYQLVQKVHTFAFTIVVLLALIFTVTLLVFKEAIKINFLSQDILDHYYAIFLAVFLINSIKSIDEYYLNATQKVKETALAKFITVIVEVISIVFLVYFFSLIGFFVSLLISACTSLVVFKHYTSRNVKTTFSLKSFREKEAKDLTKVGSSNILLLFINNLSQYLYRYIILTYLSFSFVGLFHAANSLMGYLGVINRGANFSYGPIMCQNLTTNERNKALNDYLRFNLISGTIVSSSAMLFVNQAIVFFYSNKFVGLSEYAPYFILAQFLAGLVVAFQSIVVGANEYKVHTIVVIGTNILWIVIPLLFIKELGIASIPLGMVMASIWSILFNFLYTKKKFGIEISKVVLKSILISVAFLAMAFFVRNESISIKIMLLVLIVAAVTFMANRSERKKIRTKATTVMSKLLWIR